MWHDPLVSLKQSWPGPPSHSTQKPCPGPGPMQKRGSWGAWHRILRLVPSRWVLLRAHPALEILGLEAQRPRRQKGPGEFCEMIHKEKAGPCLQDTAPGPALSVSWAVLTHSPLPVWTTGLRLQTCQTTMKNTGSWWYREPTPGQVPLSATALQCNTILPPVNTG